MTIAIGNLKDLIIHFLEEKKAEKITVIEPKNKQLATYLIFANGRSSKNIQAIAEYLLYELKHQTNLNLNIEGLGQSDWVLIDAGDIIINLFHPTAREHFQLEELWKYR